MDFEFLLDDTRLKIRLENKDGRTIIRYGEERLEADIRAVTANILSLLVAGRSRLAYLAGDGDKIYVSICGRTFLFRKPGDEERRQERGEEKSAKDRSMIRAPMPGKVIKIHVSEKDVVRKNQTLAIVEAMKMENEIKAPMDGVVKKIYAAPGDLVDSEKPLIELAPAAPPE